MTKPSAAPQSPAPLTRAEGPHGVGESTPLSPREILAGKTILLSGTTGFLGKVVLAMLLDRYPEIRRIYALIRPGISERARDRFNKTVATSPALRPLTQRHGDKIVEFLEEKVVPIDGDITKPGCAISEADLARMEADGLSLFINSAGLVDFDPPVDSALSINAHGAQNVVALTKRLNAALLHVSTCFVAGQQSGQIREDEPILDRVPPGHGADQEDRAADFDHVREIGRLGELADEVRKHAEDPMLRAQWRIAAKAELERDGRDPDDERALKSEILRQRKRWLAGELRRVGMQRSLFWGWTNTYTFTKSLGEQTIAKAVLHDGLRAAVLRPAIVESSLEFPFPGWNEGMTTSAPLIMLTQNGLPEFPYAEDLLLDIIPVDMVAGAMIAVSAALLEGSAKLIYQAASGDVNPLSIKKAIDLTGFAARKRAEGLGKKGLAGFWQRHHEMQPVSREAYGKRSIPLYRKAAKNILETVEDIGPDRFGWIRGPASAIRDVAKDVEKASGRLEKVLEMFMPFVAENKYVFRCDNTRAVMARIPEEERLALTYGPERLVWRDYWIKVHTPGLQKYVFPQLEKDLEEKPRELYVHRSLTELFETAVHRHRHNIAFHYLRKNDDEHLTYGELGRLARRVAGFLVAQGVNPDDRVLLVSENRPEWAAAYFGILLAGATAVPVDAMAKANEIINIAQAAEARGALLSPRTGRRLVFEGADPAELASAGPALWLLDQALVHKDELRQSRDPAKLASVIFTSGTTGKPKGVMLTHKNFAFEVSRLGGIFDLDTTDHLLSVLPLHHTFEFTAGLLLPLSRGARVTYLSQLSGETLGRAFKQGVSGLIGVPAVWELLQRRIEGQLDDAGLLPRLAMDGARAVTQFLRGYFDINVGPMVAYPIHRGLGGRLKHLVSGGSALNGDAMEFFRSLGFNLTEGYGLTESAPVLTVMAPKHGVVTGSVGKPLPGVEVKIDSPNDEGIGEVWARGPNVMVGYWNNPEATAEVLQDGWLRTGDLGRLDERGRLFLVGRQKDVIVDADGKNVYPDEVEEAYRDHPRIKEICVVGLDNGRGHERVAALVVPDYGKKESHLEADEQRRRRDAVKEEIREHLRKVSDGLPYAKRIKVSHFWDGELPRTSTRKAKRNEVLRVVKTLQEAHEQAAPARLELESGGHDDGSPLQLVQGVIASLTGKPADSINKQSRLAADLGFDSLMLVELATLLEPYAKSDVSSDKLMTIDRVGDLLPLLDKKSTGGGKRGAGSIAGKRRERSAEEDVFPVPAPAVSLGKSLLSLGQRAFYGRVMDVDIRGQAHIPPNAGFLVAANHASHLDAGLVKTALGRYGRSLYSLAARDYFFGTKLKRTYFGSFTNLLPIERHGAIKQSMRLALETLERGRTLLIFPEGTRSEDGELLPFKASLGYLALSAKVAVLPVYLWGTHDAMPKGSTLLPRQRRIGALIGPAFSYEALAALTAHMPRGEAYRTATAVIEKAIWALRDGESYQPELLLAEARRAAAEPRQLSATHGSGNGANTGAGHGDDDSHGAGSDESSGPVSASNPHSRHAPSGKNQRRKGKPEAEA